MFPHGDTCAILPDFQTALHSKAAGYLFVSNRKIPPDCAPQNLLVLRPRNLVVGIGCNSGTEADEIERVVLANLEKLALSLKSVCCLASAVAKRNEAGLLAFAGKYSIPITFYESSELNVVSIPSPTIPACVESHRSNRRGGAGCPACLAGGCLLLNKVKSGNVTLAIAEKC